MSAARPFPVALTIGGSDSGAGAGIQADLRTFNALGLFGTSAITCVTAQNLNEVSHIQAMDAKLVSAQIERVSDVFPLVAVKTGMLYSSDIIKAVADLLPKVRNAPIVVDPVMVATSGARLLEADAVRTLCERLFPLATVLTPNIPEAELLAAGRIADLEAQREAARRIGERYGVACIVKGGHLEGDRLSDVLFSSGELHHFEFHRSVGRSTHGTGCTFGAALAARLGLGDTMRDAVNAARHYVKRCLEGSHQIGAHSVMGWGA